MILSDMIIIFAFFVSLHVIADVTMNDRGLYSCNLHHLYCHLYETVRVQLNVTKSRMYHRAIHMVDRHTATWKLSVLCFFCTFPIKAAKNSVTGMDRRRCMWCCSAVPWCCHASTDVTCGQTGATRRRTSRCVSVVSV